MTVLVGDNGSGKSTIVEALAIGAGFNAEGGGHNLRFSTHDTHGGLHEHLKLTWRRRPPWGWFLRAETFYAMATTFATDADHLRAYKDLHVESHGESFLELAQDRFQSPGFYVFDEPESALSIQGQMVLARIVYESVAQGSQFVIATHSPFLAAYPGAALYELSDVGIAPATFDDLASTTLWRRLLDDPARFYAPLLADDEP